MQNFRLLTDLDDKRIIQFLIDDSGAEIYHHPAWIKSIIKTFNHKAYYLLLEDSGKNILGLFPFVLLNSPITGKRIVSPPFSTYCDLLFPNDLIPVAISFLKEQFPEYKRIELRTLKSYSQSLSNFTNTQDFVTHFLELTDSITKTFDSFHGTSVRASIRRAEKNNLKIRFGNTIEDLKIFHHFETSLRKRLDFPPLPLKFFYNLWMEFARYDLIYLPIIYKGSEPIAAGFILNFKETFYLEYTASEKKFFNLYPYHKLFWEVIKLAHNNGAKMVDFGRSSADNLNLTTFKEKWNTKKHNIHHYYLPKTDILHSNKKIFLNVLETINKVLPKKILELEGRIIYPHLS
jgi:hypothetical protein